MRESWNAPVPPLAAALLLTLGLHAPASAQGISINDPPDAPFDYSVCYAANDTLNPGP